MRRVRNPLQRVTHCFSCVMLRAGSFEPVFSWTRDSAMSPYVAPRWLPGGHLQTMYAALLAPHERVTYARERWETPDADFVDVDWLAASAQRQVRRAGADATNASPLVVLFHGLEGRSTSQYAYALMLEVANVGWTGVVVHFRGCSGAPNR